MIVNMNIRIRFTLAAVLCISTMLLTVSCEKQEPRKPVRVGIAWRGDSTAITYTSTLLSVREAGAIPVPLPLLKFPQMEYDGDQLQDRYLDNHGILLQEYADSVKPDPLRGQNLSDLLKGLDALIFTGGSDISPTLYKIPEPWHGIESEGMYDGRRDVSDYILMSWCLEREEKLPVLCICRGMQMLGVVSGTSMIQDLRTYFEDQALYYNDEHRIEPSGGQGRNFASHSVQVTDESSLIRQITGNDVIERVPSWHHQAIRSVEGTALKITAVTTTEGIDIIESVERTDRPFFLGLQFHPEVAVSKHVNKDADASRFMSYEEAMRYFRALVKGH